MPPGTRPAPHRHPLGPRPGESLGSRARPPPTPKLTFGPDAAAGSALLPPLPPQPGLARAPAGPELAPRGPRRRTFLVIVTAFPPTLPLVPFHFRGCSGSAGSVTTSRWLPSGGGTGAAAAYQERPPARACAFPGPGLHGH